MKKVILLCLVITFSYQYLSAQKADFVPPKNIPRNIIIVLANGMGVNQLTAATLKKGSQLIFSRFPVTGFTQAWTPNTDAPTDSSTATAIATNKTKDKPAGKTLFTWAKEKKMMTGIITTNTVTSANSKIFAFENYDKKDDEALAVDYLNTDIKVLVGGGSRFFDKRYDGRNLFNDFKKAGYHIENTNHRAENISIPKSIGIVSKYGLYRASERKDFLTETTISVTRAMTNPDGYMLLIDDSKIEEADTLNDIKLLNEEILDLDKMLTQFYPLSGGETLVLVIGNYECGGLTVKDGYIAKKSEPDVKWLGKTPTAALAPVFAYGPGSDQFSGIYTLPEIYSKLENMMIKRR
jgi:alkaline phosphatase